MVVGTGIDLVPVARLRRFRERRAERGLRRLFTDAELGYCLRLAAPDRSLAARFAAKEAFFKAIGTGYGREGGGWRDVEVLREASGRPGIRLHGRAARYAEQRGIRRIHLSLSHTDEVATAIVLLEA